MLLISRELPTDGNSDRHLNYSGNTTTVTDPAGKWKTYTTDAMGNLIQVTEPAPEGGTHLTTYAYNLFNQLTTVTMPRSTGTQTRTFNYDLPTAHLTSVTNPESGTVTFAYNPDGTLLSKTDAKGQKIQFTYDTYGRVTVKQTYKSGGTEDLCGKATSYWDTRPSGVGSSGWQNVSGRLMAMRWSDSSCPGGQFTEGYQYDTGLPTIKRLYAPPLGSNSYIDASFTYTDQGQLQSMAYPVWHGGGTQWPAAGKTFTYSLDTLSRPIGLTDEAQTAWVSGVTYGGTNGPAGQMTAMTYGTGTQIYAETFAYNVRGQLTNLTATGNGLASVNLQYKFAAFPNNDGRLTQMEDAVSGEETNYLYDSLGRLTYAHTTGTQWGQTFAYDGFGNLTAETATKGPAPSVTRTYDPATNRLTGAGYTYDANGNLTAMPSLTMTYNVENRMTQAVNTNFNETDNYGYDPAGLRLWKQSMTDSVIHVYYNGRDGKPLADFYLQNSSVQGGTPMVYFAGKRVDNGSVEDRLGTAVVEGGTTRMAYFPYGELRSGTSTEIQFATYKRDSTTNLDYAQQRYYSSQIVRFTMPDPSQANSGAPGDPEDPQSWNRYSYVQNDPINHNDPSGQEWCSVGWGEGHRETVSCEIVSFLYVFHETIADYDDVHGIPPCKAGYNLDSNGHCVFDPQAALEAATKRVTDDLKKPDCAKDFKNVNDDLNSLGKTSFKDLGGISYTSTPGPGGRNTGAKGTEGEYIPVFHNVFLNSEINWGDPNNTPALKNGQPGTYPLLSADANKDGDLSMTADQFMDIAILHELAHRNSSIGDPDKVSVEQQLWKDCVK